MGGNGCEGPCSIQNQGQQQCPPPYPGSRKARFSRTTRVTIGSLGTSQATRPSFSRGTLHQRREKVSEMLNNQGNGERPSPPPTHLGTCQTILTGETTVARGTLGRSRKEAEGEDGSSPPCLEGVPPGSKEPSIHLLPQYLWGSSHSLKDPENLTYYLESVPVPLGRSSLFYATLGTGGTDRLKMPMSLVLEGEEKRTLSREVIRHCQIREPQDWACKPGTPSLLTLSPGGPMGPAPPGSPRAPLLPSSPAGPGAPWGPAGP